ncbi:MAG: hypothetical protein HFE63_07610 [Clostridiales bacterium]|nr:hypothetical protein [Clostridiales bacterium]
MQRTRKILLYTLIGILIAFELVTGYLNYDDRGKYFAGLGAMLIYIWLMPAMIGLLLGVRDGLNDRNKYSFIRGLFTAAAIMLLHALTSSIIYTFTSSPGAADLVDALAIFPLWSLGVGYAIYFAALLITKLIYQFVRGYLKYRRAQKERHKN